MNYETRIEVGQDGTQRPDGESVMPPTAADPHLAGSPLDHADIDFGRGRRQRRLIIIAVLVAAGLIALWYATHRQAPAAAGDAAAQAPTVSVIVPGSHPVAGTISATGTLAARRELPVGSVGDGGAVAAVPVDAGQWGPSRPGTGHARPVGAERTADQPAGADRRGAGRCPPGPGRSRPGAENWSATASSRARKSTG